MGNLAVVMHVASAVIIMLAGAVQLVPQVRNRFPVFHRWNGRIYMLTAVTLSMAGLYMTWIRGSVGDLSRTPGFYSERRPDLALRRHGAALCAGSRFQNSSPLGSSLLPGGKCVLVLPDQDSSCRFSSLKALSVSTRLRFGDRSSLSCLSPNTCCPSPFLKSISGRRTAPARCGAWRRQACFL